MAVLKDHIPVDGNLQRFCSLSRFILAEVLTKLRDSDSRSSQQCCWKFMSSGKLQHAGWQMFFDDSNNSIFFGANSVWWPSPVEHCRSRQNIGKNLSVDTAWPPKNV